MAGPRRTSNNAATTTQQLSSVIKSCRDIMRKDKGLNGDLDRLPMLTWVLFLKFLDDLEQMREAEASLEGIRFSPAIDPPYRWRDWGSQPDGITGDALVAFINQDEAIRPDGSRGPGLFATLRRLPVGHGTDRREVIRAVFNGTSNRMLNGYLLRDMLNKINSIHFTSSEEISTLGHLYESMLKDMRDAAGDSGEFYTPRPLVRFIIAATDPRLGETVLDPACGTGGFLTEAFEHLQKQCRTTEDHRRLQRDTLHGVEAKALPYLLCQMNLLLHGLEAPQIDPLNALRHKLGEIGDGERVDIVVTNPPFGGEEQRGILGNFPADKQTAETTLLFLQLIMRKLRRGANPGRAAVIVPNTTLFSPGVAAAIRAELLREFNLHTVVRLPKGVFLPYTDIETNILFFDRSRPTERTLFYRLLPPDDRKQYSKTQPLRLEELGECLKLMKSRRDESKNAWYVSASDVLADSKVNLDLHNPKIITLTNESVTGVVQGLQTALDQISDSISSAAAAIRTLEGTLSEELEWGELSLDSVLLRRKDPIDITDGDRYKRLRIQVKGRGVLLRDEVDGATIGTKRQFIVKSGQFVLSKIDARNGAFGVVPEEGDGAVITGNFWAYDVDERRILPRLLHYLTRSNAFIHFCSVSSPGATNRRYLQEDLFLQQRLTVPVSLEDQQILSDALDTVETISRALEFDFAAASKRAPVLLQSALHLVFGGPLEDSGVDNDGADTSPEPEED